MHMTHSPQRDSQSSSPSAASRMTRTYNSCKPVDRANRIPLRSRCGDTSDASSIWFYACCRIMKTPIRSLRRRLWLRGRGCRCPAVRRALRAFLSRIIYYCCVRQLERRARATLGHTGGKDYGWDVQREADGRDPGATRLAGQGARAEGATADQVPHGVDLRHLQEMAYEEMADILTMPVGTIKSRLLRARHLLKERLLAQYDTHSSDR